MPTILQGLYASPAVRFDHLFMSQPANNVVAVYDAHGHEWDADRRAEVRPDGHAFEHHWLERVISLLPIGSSVWLAQRAS